MQSARTHLKKRENGIITFTREITWLGSIGGTGWGNGYFALPASHQWYGLGYDDIPLDVHYGLTYAEAEEIDGIEYWVIGFDTCHYGDNISKWSEEILEKYVDNVFEEQLKGLAVS